MTRWEFAGAVMVAGLAAVSALGFAQGAGETPAQLEGVDIVDRSGDELPGELEFKNEAGERVRLGDYLHQGRPVVVQLVYFNCPMLCTLVLNGFVEGASQLDWVPGVDYDVVSVSFDDTDTPELAAQKKSNYVAALGKPGAEAGWHFLTGEKPEIEALAGALGFQFRWDEKQEEFAHAAGMFVVSPQGVISRTLYGIEYPPKELRLSLVEAAEGRLGSPLDRLLLYCFRYNPETHKYALVAVNIMKLGGLLTVIALSAFLAVHWSRERQRAPRPAA